MIENNYSMCYCSFSCVSEYSGQCFVTLRGHADSVNSVMWLPYSNTLTTCSADKTVSLWDARTVSALTTICAFNMFVSQGLCVQTFYGHNNSCNDVISNCQAVA